MAADPVVSAEQSLLAGHGPVPGLSSCSFAGSQVSCAASPASAVPLASGVVAPASWTDLSSASSPPPGRYLAAMTWDPVDNYVLMFGGFSTGGALSDTWAFSDNQWTQLSPATSPPARYVATLAWDAADHYAVLFGGFNGISEYYNDTWTFAGGTWTNITGTTNQTPEGRWRQSMTWDAADGYIVMFGGTNSAGTALAETWSFVHGNWTKLTVTGSPPGRYRATMAYDAVDGYAVVFGGCTSNCPDSSTWTYHNLTWKSVSASTHPSARIYFGMTYSPIYQHVLLFGGSSSTGNTPLSDTWAFANDTWTDITSNLSRSPAARAYLEMSFDAVDNYSIIYGGQWTNGTYIDQTWALGPSILGKLVVAPATIDLGQTAHLNATPFAYSQYVTYNYTQLPPGCTSANVSLLACTPTATGSFPLTVTLNDSSGVPATESGSLAVNSDPLISSFTVSSSTVTRGTPVQFEVSAAGGTGTYSYHYSGLPPGCVSANVHNLTCTPGSTASGPYSVKVDVVDQASFAVNQSLVLTVNPTPTFSSVTARPTVLDAGQPLTIWANLSAGTGTPPFTYFYAGLPTGCTSTNTSTLTCTPTAAGSSFITVSATDVFGFAAGGNVTVTVNTDPAISSSAVLPSPVDVGTPVSVWVNASGGTGVLTYRFHGAPPGCVLHNSSLNICTPTSAGTFTIGVNVTDQAGWVASTTLELVVNPGFASTGMTASPPALDLGQNLTLTVLASGGTGPFSYSWSGLPAGCPSTTAGPTLTCVPHVAGTFSVTVTGTDAFQATVSAGVQVIVYPVPQVSSFAASQSPATEGQSVDLTVTVAGGSGVYTYAYASLPPGCSGANHSVLHCTPSTTGTYNITVTVTDSLGSVASGYLVLTVSSPSTGGFLGLSGSTGTLLLVLIVVVVVVAIAAVLLLRRRRAPPPEPVAEVGPEEAPPPEEQPPD